MVEICDMSGEELRAARGLGKVTAAEICAGAVARIEALNPALKAFVATRFEEALQEAQTQDQPQTHLSPLAGLPVAVKDLNDVAGLPTTYGSALYADNIATKDDDVVQSLRGAGGIILGKTNVR